MVKQKLSVEERGRRNRVYQKKRRKKLNSDPERKKEIKKNERQRCKRLV